MIDPEDEEEQDVKVSIFDRDRRSCADGIKVTKKQSEMLFVRGTLGSLFALSTAGLTMCRRLGGSHFAAAFVVKHTREDGKQLAMYDSDTKP